MPAAFFHPELVERLPLWAQVYLVARLLRRACEHLPQPTAAVIDAVQAVCDRLDRAATTGGRTQTPAEGSTTAVAALPPACPATLRAACRGGLDAAAAAADALDFSAAETACQQSTLAALAELQEFAGWNPLQFRIWFAADVDQLQFACQEMGQDRYAGLDSHVFGRMTTIRGRPAPGRE